MIKKGTKDEDAKCIFSGKNMLRPHRRSVFVFPSPWNNAIVQTLAGKRGKDQLSVSRHDLLSLDAARSVNRARPPYL